MTIRVEDHWKYAATDAVPDDTFSRVVVGDRVTVAGRVGDVVGLGVDPGDGVTPVLLVQFNGHGTSYVWREVVDNIISKENKNG